eukprot:362987-Chlamydomonas_euryale.AAC.3
MPAHYSLSLCLPASADPPPCLTITGPGVWVRLGEPHSQQYCAFKRRRERPATAGHGRCAGGLSCGGGDAANAKVCACLPSPANSYLRVLTSTVAKDHSHPGTDARISGGTSAQVMVGNRHRCIVEQVAQTHKPGMRSASHTRMRALSSRCLAHQQLVYYAGPPQ